MEKKANNISRREALKRLGRMAAVATVAGSIPSALMGSSVAYSSFTSRGKAAPEPTKTPATKPSPTTKPAPSPTPASRPAPYQSYSYNSYGEGGGITPRTYSSHYSSTYSSGGGGGVPSRSYNSYMSYKSYRN